MENPMPASRLMPTRESADLIRLTREISSDLLLARAAKDEESGSFPRDLFVILGDLGLLGLPYPTDFGGGNQPYEVYLQVVEELATAWSTIAVGTSVHVLSCWPTGKGAGNHRPPAQRLVHRRRILAPGGRICPFGGRYGNSSGKA